MNGNKIRVALLIDKSASYDRGLIQGIIKYSNLIEPWEFFLVRPDYMVVDNKKKFIKKIINWKPDCIVLNDRFSLSDFSKLNIPIMVTSSKHRKLQEAINIISDDNTIGKLGANYFINKGFKNFAFYGSDKIFWSLNRKNAFRETVLSKGLNFFEMESLLNNKWQSNPHQLIPWLRELPKQVAIMAGSDEFGVHLIKAAKLAQLNVPEEISILGVDNDEFMCNLYGLPMSSIDQKPEAVGFEVAKCIRSILVGGKKQPKEIVGTSLRVVTRLSTDIFAIDDPQLKIALAFIQSNSSNKKLTVDEIVSETSLSRR
jgi:LacI family transcriptional regulator